MSNSKLMENSRTYSGAFPSPETPPCGEEHGPSIEIPKGWSSERVPRSSYCTRRHIAAAAMMPFSSGRTLPSKWEDAERWICSPVSLGNISTNSNYCYYGTGPGAGPGGGSRTGSRLSQYQRRAKSKSGPMGPVGSSSFYGGGYSTFSPVLGVGVINNGRWRNSLNIESSGLASARFEDRLSMDGAGFSEEGRKSCPGHATHWLDTWSGPPTPIQGEVSLNEENNNEMSVSNNKENCDGTIPRVDRIISRRDMATQMFADSQSSSPPSAVSSSKSSVSATSPCPLLLNNESKRDPEFEVRDVQIDKQASTSRSHLNVHHVRDNYSNSTTTMEADNKISKYGRKEARINAWENLQKAKAEAAIQKLEEELEKKRASSMNKIIKKLRRAEVKAVKMKSSLSTDGDQSDHTEIQTISKISKIPSFCKKIRLKSSTKSCVTCFTF